MGSFINQCMASRQVIMEGGPCRIIPLIQQRSFHPASCVNPSRPDAPAQQVYGPEWGAGVDLRWKPVMGFLEAKAQDRSGIELVFNDHNRIQLAHLFSQMSRRAAVSTVDSSRDENFDFGKLLEQHAPQWLESAKDQSWYAEDVVMNDTEALALWTAMDEDEAFRRNHIFMADNFGVYRPLMLGVVHEDAYQWLLKEGQKTTRYDGYDRVKHIDDVAAEAVEMAKEFMTKALDKPGEQEMVTAQVTLHATQPLREGLKRISDDAYGSAEPWARKLTFLVMEHFKTGMPLGDLIRKNLKEYLDDSYVLQGLRMVNVPLEPMLYAGQDYDNQAGKRYASMVTAMRN